MTKWRDGGNLGRLDRVIIGGSDEVCTVRTRRDVYFDEGEGDTRCRGWRMQPWPEGEENFRLILQAPRMLEALEAIVALDPSYWCQTEPENAVCDQCKEIARAAIAAVKGESNGLES